MPEMNENTLHEKHLVQVNALCQQISSAISAIERSDLEQLRSSVAMQETLCQEICSTDWERLAKPVTQAPRRGESALVAEIRTAHTALAKLNRLYAAVLKRSERSCGLITAIYRNFAQGYSKDRVTNGHHTWSCEG